MIYFFLLRIVFQNYEIKISAYLGFFSQQQKNLEGYVGFASLPNQVYRKSVKRGFEFTLMVVGKRTVFLRAECILRACVPTHHRNKAFLSDAC